MVSRSTIGNVETGRQHCDVTFWSAADQAVHAGGSLIVAHEELEDSARRARAGEVLATKAPGETVLPVIYPSGLQSPHTVVSAAPAHPGDTGMDMVAAAATHARDHAAHTAITSIGPGTVEQLTAEVIRLSRAYVTGSPLPLFTAMQQVLARVQTALNEKLYPAQARDLTFLAGALCGLMSNATLDLGLEEAADDLARASWTYATVIDHSPLMGWARGAQALAAIWDHRYTDAVGYAEDGLAHLETGMGAARLHAIRARALAGHHDFTQAKAALEAAHTVAATQQADPLHHGIAGEFAFSDAKLHYYEALVLSRSGYPSAAESAAAAAVSLYQAAPGTARSYGCEALARLQLAVARLMRGNAEGAAEAIGGLLRLDPGRRISSLQEQVNACQTLLRSPAYRASPAATELDQHLTTFGVVTISTALPGSM
jgi:hypothetical protein